MRQLLFCVFIMLLSISGLSSAEPSNLYKEYRRHFGMPAYIQDRVMPPRFGGPVPYYVYSPYYQPVARPTYYWNPIISSTKTRYSAPSDSYIASPSVTTDYSVPLESERTSTTITIPREESTNTIETSSALPLMTTPDPAMDSPGASGTQSPTSRLAYHENMEPN